MLVSQTIILSSSLFLVSNALVARDPMVIGARPPVIAQSPVIPRESKKNIAAAVKKEQDTSRCEKGPFFIVQNKVVKEKAVEGCATYHGELANVDNGNFNLITTLLHQCQGNEARAWIKSWDGTDYGSNCLTLYAGHTIPGGGIDTDCIDSAQALVCSRYYDPPAIDPIYPPIYTDPLLQNGSIVTTVLNDTLAAISTTSPVTTSATDSSAESITL